MLLKPSTRACSAYMAPIKSYYDLSLLCLDIVRWHCLSEDYWSGTDYHGRLLYQVLIYDQDYIWELLLIDRFLTVFGVMILSLISNCYQVMLCTRGFALKWAVRCYILSVLLLWPHTVHALWKGAHLLSLSQPQGLQSVSHSFNS